MSTVFHSPRIAISQLASACAMVCLLAGCGSSTRVMVTAQPPDAAIVVTDASGKVIAQSTDKSPGVAQASLDFTRSASYQVTASPQGALGESHAETTLSFVESEYNSLPETEQSGTRSLVVRLTEREFGLVDQLLVYVSKEGEWQGLRQRVRAFDTITEEAGAPPVLVLDLGERLSLQGLDISPDGQRLVFGEVDAKPIEGNDHTVMIAAANIRGANLGGGGLQQITSGPYRDVFPAFTSEGDRLLFASNRRRPNAADLLLTSAGGASGISNVYVDPRNQIAMTPSQAADGTIVFALIDPQERRQSFIWTVGGRNQFPTQIVRGSDPRISPDGKRIAYIGTDRNLWVVDIDGSNQTQLTTNAGEIRQRFLAAIGPLEMAAITNAEAIHLDPLRPYAHPSWSADGRRLLVASLESNDRTGRPNHDIWMLNQDGSQRQQVTTNGSADLHPMMSPDLRHIYFVSNRGKRWGIYRIDTPTR